MNVELRSTQEYPESDGWLIHWKTRPDRLCTDRLRTPAEWSDNI